MNKASTGNQTTFARGFGSDTTHPLGNASHGRAREFAAAVPPSSIPAASGVNEKGQWTAEPVVHTTAGAHFGTFQDISAIRGEVKKSPENGVFLAFSGKPINRVQSL
jgi:hypothetical protein